MDISIIITLYNKSEYISNTVQSALELDDGYTKDIIIVDDNSQDSSCEIVRAIAKQHNNVILISSNDNKGPATRLNQGVNAARGKYLLFLDGDDLLPANICKILIPIIISNKADFLYGKRLNSELQKDTNYILPAQVNYKISYNPIKTVLNGKYVRTNLICLRETFLYAGGCEKKIFIQDESLPLNLALVSKIFISIDDYMVIAPFDDNHSKDSNKLSANSRQENYDRFFAYYYNIEQSLKLDFGLRRKFYLRILSSYWKFMRKNSPSSDTTLLTKIKRMINLVTIFLIYNFYKMIYLKPSLMILHHISKKLLLEKGIRRNL